MREVWNTIKSWLSKTASIDKDMLISLLFFVIVSMAFTWIFGWAGLGHGIAYLAAFIGCFAINFLNQEG
jgi:hypothetical protein